MLAIEAIVATASTGYSPEADSAESMTASAPSKTAVATSETSARVGTGAEIINSSIWVATTTGLPERRQARISCFCRPGTDSSGISTPRSPRATINASESSMISSIRSIACGFSIFDIRPTRPRDDLAHFRQVFRALHEGQRDPVDIVGRQHGVEIGAVLFRQRADAEQRVGQADALPVGNLGAGNDRLTMLLPSHFSASQMQLAVVDQQAMAGLDGFEDFRMRQEDAGCCRRARPCCRA